MVSAYLPRHEFLVFENARRVCAGAMVLHKDVARRCCASGSLRLGVHRGAGASEVAHRSAPGAAGDRSLRHRSDAEPASGARASQPLRQLGVYEFICDFAVGDSPLGPSRWTAPSSPRWRKTRSIRPSSVRCCSWPGPGLVGSSEGRGNRNPGAGVATSGRESPARIFIRTPAAGAGHRRTAAPGRGGSQSAVGLCGRARAPGAECARHRLAVHK